MNVRIFFSISILILITNLLSGQVAFPPLDAHWCYDGYTELSFDPFSFCIEPSELVELNGNIYSRITTFTNPYDDWQDILYRGEGRKFYVIPQDSTEEILIYDFDLEVGDTFVVTWGWQIWDSTTLEVGWVDTIITADGLARKRISLQSVGNYGTWIEGIGSGEWSFVYPGYSGWLDNGYYFTCHFQEEEPIYSSWGIAELCDLDAITNTSETEINSGFDVFPNPTSDILNISFLDLNIEELRIIDLSGNIVYQNKINSQNYHLQVENILESGVYLIKVYGSDGLVITKKFVKI